MTSHSRVRVEHGSVHTGGKDDWQTPQELVDRIFAFGDIGLDPCTDASNPVGAARFFTEAEDGLRQSWATGGGLVYVNPPYSASKQWLAKITQESRKGHQVIALVACRPCTRYWAKYVWPHARAVCFIGGRLTFRGAENVAPFESCLLYYGGRVGSFASHFASLGKVVAT